MAKKLSIDTNEEAYQKEYKRLLFRNALSLGASERINIMLDWKYFGKTPDKEAIEILTQNTHFVARMAKKDKTYIELLMKRPELIKGSHEEKVLAITILVGYSEANPQEAEKLLQIFGLDKLPDEVPDSIHRGPLDEMEHFKMQRTTERGSR